MVILAKKGGVDQGKEFILEGFYFSILGQKKANTGEIRQNNRVNKTKIQQKLPRERVKIRISKNLHKKQTPILGPKKLKIRRLSLGG